MSTYTAYCVLLLNYDDKIPIKNIEIGDRLVFSIVTKEELEFPTFPSKHYGLIECRYDEENWTPFDEAGNPIFNFVSAMRLVKHDIYDLYVDALYDYNHDEDSYMKIYSDWVPTNTPYYSLIQSDLDEIIFLYEAICKKQNLEIYSALVKYDSYVNEKDAGWQYVKLINILEMLFPPAEPRYISRQIAHSCSEYITQDMKIKNDIYKNIVKYYRFRNLVIHNLNKEFDTGILFDVFQLDKYVREALKRKFLE